MAERDQTLDIERTRVKLTPGQIATLVGFVVTMTVGFIEMRLSISHVNDRLDGSSDSPGFAARVKQLEGDNRELSHDLFVVRQDVSELQKLVKSGTDPQTLHRVSELLERIVTTLPERRR